MKANELIHKGLYKLGDKVVMFNALNGCVYEPTCKFSSCIGKVYEDAETGKLEVRTENGEWEELQPIPLTAEILESNGFKERDKFAWYHKESLLLVNTPNTNKVSITAFNCCVVITYVHELQRALRCCGLTELADGFTL